MRKILTIPLICSVSFLATEGFHPAHAQIDDPYYENFFGNDLNDSLDSQAEISQGNASINRILKVLRQKPAAASTACLQALSTMRKARKQLKKAADEASDSENRSNFDLAQDVFGSSVMDVNTMCGADAHTLCREHQYESAALTQSCPLLEPDSEEEH
ncbi:hypothetical protein PT277_09280 [Acetobacteraceae bacterium ESL0709]|nr:hypothetical protein [Acetobacteraceae bacterium ESL0697]MDF7678873.1 hypothetical protein [Acetobacteraceae bacterium ESL0709]